MGTADPRGRAEDRSPDIFREKMLANQSRKRILRLLKCHPGMNKHQLATRLGMNANAVEFHIQRMIDLDLVETRKRQRGREIFCFTPENVRLWDDPRTRVLFGRGPAREVALYIADHPGAKCPEVAESLGVSINTVRRHIRLLESAELVQRLRVEQEVYYHAAPRLERWVEEVAERWACALGDENSATPME